MRRDGKTEHGLRSSDAACSFGWRGRWNVICVSLWYADIEETGAGGISSNTFRAGGYAPLVRRDRQGQFRGGA